MRARGWLSGGPLPSVGGKVGEERISPRCCFPDLDGVFVTHEHVDHVKGIVTFAKKYQVPLYASQGTWRAVFSRYPELNRANCRLTGQRLSMISVGIRRVSVEMAVEVGHPALN